jgi:hypothetical protein
MTSYTLQVQPQTQYTIEYSNQRGPQGPAGAAGPATTDASLLVSGTLAVVVGGTGLNALGSALQVLRVNAGGTALEYGTVSGGGAWGSITGTLADQTDLQAALDAKASTSAVAAGYQPLDSDLTAIAALTTTSTGRALLTESVAQTGTGALVRAAGPTLTGTTSVANLTASGTVSANAVQLSGVDLHTALVTNLRSIDMGWTTGVVTGSASTGPQGSTTSTNRIDNQTGTTAGSTFVRSLGIWGGTDNAAFHETLTYSRPISFLCSLYRTSTSTNSIARFLIANQNGATALAAPGFGFEIRNERIWIVAHDGATLTQLDTGVNWYTGAVNLMRCESNGAGSISLFRGNTSIGTITGGPTGTFPGYLSVSGTNGADSSSLRFQYNRLIYVRV